MLSSTELAFLRGVVADEAYPYYFIWQEADRSPGQTYRTVHVYLDKEPVDVSGRAFSVGSNSRYYTLVNDQSFTLVDSGILSGSVPSDAVGYTNTSDTPAFADLLEPTLEISREVPFNIPLVVLVVFAASLVAGIVRTVLFGGKS